MIIHYKLDDRSWKGILVRYGGTNQWKVYNPKTKRIYLSRDVRFDEKYSYYSNDGIGAPDCFEEESDEEDIAEFWTDKDDEKLAELQGEQVSVGVNPISRYRLLDDVAEEEEEFQDAPEGNRQQTSLPEDPVLRSPMPPPAVLGRPRDPIPDDIFDRNAATGAAESSTSSHPPPVSEDESDRGLESGVTVIGKRSKAPSPLPSYRETRSSRNGDNRPNYKDLHRGINFAESKHYCHMNRVFAALASGDSLGLGLLYTSEPRSYKEARKSIEWPHWKKAIEAEIQSYMENETWTLAKLPNGRKAITGRWVFKIKYGLDGSILRYKARWVIYGYKQMEGVDFSSTWAGVVKPASFRTLFAIAAARNLHILQLDIVTAFLYGLLDEEIYVSQPDGFIEDPTLVCHLRKALYGLKQAPRVWYAVIREFLKGMGFASTSAD